MLPAAYLGAARVHGWNCCQHRYRRCCSALQQLQCSATANSAAPCPGQFGACINMLGLSEAVWGLALPGYVLGAGGSGGGGARLAAVLLSSPESAWTSPSSPDKCLPIGCWQADSQQQKQHTASNPQQHLFGSPPFYVVNCSHRRWMSRILSANKAWAPNCMDTCQNSTAPGAPLVRTDLNWTRDQSHVLQMS